MTVSVRPLAALAALLALVGSLLALGAAPSSAAAPHRTKVVLEVTGCEGCEVHLQQGLRDSWWFSDARTVRDGRAVFSVPSRRTQGMSIQITGPWEASSPHPSGFRAVVTLRYRGVAAGETVTGTVARTKRRGSACYPGTKADRLVLHIEAHRAVIDGEGGRAVTTRAWASPQTVTMPHTQERLHRGINGEQDVLACA